MVLVFKAAAAERAAGIVAEGLGAVCAKRLIAGAAVALIIKSSLERGKNRDKTTNRKPIPNFGMPNHLGAKLKKQSIKDTQGII